MTLAIHGRSNKRWRFVPHDAVRIARLEQAAGVSPIVAQLLISRGVCDGDAARTFLDAKLTGLRDPDLAAVKLGQALDEIAKTYQALDTAIASYLSLALDEGALQSKSKVLLDIEGGGLSTEVERGRGHCHVIGNIYVQHLDRWFARALKPNEYEEIRDVFYELGNADDDVFVHMVDVAQGLEKEAEAVLESLIKGDLPVARQRVLGARSELKPLRLGSDFAPALDHEWRVRRELLVALAQDYRSGVAAVRHENGIVEAAQGMVHGQRLGVEHVQRRSGDPPGAERGKQRRPCARGDDAEQACSVSDRIEDMYGRRDQSCAGDESGACEKLFLHHAIPRDAKKENPPQQALRSQPHNSGDWGREPSTLL